MSFRYFAHLDDVQEGGQSFSCAMCGKVYNSKLNLKRHMTYVCGKEAQYSCPHCPHKSKLKWNLKKHVDRMHASATTVPSLTCHKCPYTTNKTSQLSSLLKADSGSCSAVDAIIIVAEEYSCCLFQVRRFELLFTEGGEDEKQTQTFKCESCGKLYAYLRGLRQHKKYECGKDPQFKCSYCPYRAKQKANLKRHIFLWHNQSSSFYFCDLCPYRTKIEPQLTLHYALFHKTYKRSPKLVIFCSRCRRRFTHPGRLRRHIETECGKGPAGTAPRFQCHRCPYATKRKDTLIAHLNDVHPPMDSTASDRGGAFACHSCPRTYRHVDSLRRHLRYECGKEPQFKCPHCPHRTKIKANLTQHVNLVHNPNPRLYSCPLCQFTTKYKSKYLSHIMLLHGLEDKSLY
ncbi:hypothetical protein AAG570_013971 [Ranatra chinensis]|uniref:C2H2-type domain-containing protein n=1 Tax=Ranatra chinensis TaxID=642074 RepID=A0ABD0YDS2_9HEMI